MSLASAKEADNRVRTTVVLREPPFTDYGAETGTEAGKETCEPKAIHSDRGTSGFLGDSRIGYVRQVWVTTIQQLMKEQGRL